MDVIRNIIGSAVEGKNFFGRTKKIAEALELLEDGNSLILAAPRRVGKSSFARKILENEGYIMRHEDNYSFRSPLLRDFWYNQFGK